MTVPKIHTFWEFHEVFLTKFTFSKIQLKVRNLKEAYNERTFRRGLGVFIVIFKNHQRIDNCFNFLTLNMYFYIGKVTS